MRSMLLQPRSGADGNVGVGALIPDRGATGGEKIRE
jgi:hypothetical protein